MLYLMVLLLVGSTKSVLLLRQPTAAIRASNLDVTESGIL
jgi:hypothetical protein